jgi:hypothetical protein
MNARVYEYVCEHVTSLADFIEKKHELIKERQQVDLKAAYTSSLRPLTLVA